MILTALERAGGANYLLTQAERNPGAFLTLIGKIIPLQAELTGKGGGPIALEFEQALIRARQRVANTQNRDPNTD